MQIIKIYTDGACSGNPGVGGWGAIVVSEDNVTEISGYSEVTTNNKMEMMAAIKAMEFVREKYNNNEYSVFLYTDSKYLQQGISSWIWNWKLKGWKTASGGQVKNYDLWIILDELINNADKNVELIHVRGHSDNFGNTKADELARSAIYQKCSKTITRPIATGESW